jgi:ABC-2 type transport system ATP-binding protein
MTNEDGRIVVAGLTKTYGTLRAVDDLSFTVEPGTITGFLGPNGAGKTTTLRMLLGLITPDAGTATIGGHLYRALPARSGRNHLRIYCTVNGYPSRRADQVLELVDLADAGRRPVRGYSLGMRQRLALATALLGDPRVLILDEPANGLDPEGIAWLRRLLRSLADEGRTVLVSSHVLSEVQQLVDQVVILHSGRLVRQGTLAELADRQAWVSVRTPHADQLRAALARSGIDRPQIQQTGPDHLRITGLAAAEVGHLALAEQVELHELATERSDLEQAFFALTAPAENAPALTLREVR